jgi:hypothetical protein
MSARRSRPEIAAAAANLGTVKVVVNHDRPERETIGRHGLLPSSEEANRRDWQTKSASEVAHAIGDIGWGGRTLTDVAGVPCCLATF